MTKNKNKVYKDKENVKLPVRVLKFNLLMHNCYILCCKCFDFKHYVILKLKCKYIQVMKTCLMCEMPGLFQQNNLSILKSQLSVYQEHFKMF